MKGEGEGGRRREKDTGDGQKGGDGNMRGSPRLKAGGRRQVE